MRASKICFGLLISAALAVSCTQPDRRTTEDQGGDGSFVVSKLRGTGSTVPLKDGLVWRVPTEFTVSGWACVKDRASQRELRGQKFFVSIPGTTKGYDVETTNEGCFRWDEDPMPFNYFAGRSGWVEIVRDIVGRDVNTGTRRVVIGVNPWAMGDHPRDKGISAVISKRDGDDGYLPKSWFEAKDAERALAGEHKLQTGPESRAWLFIPKVSVSPTPEQAAVGFTTFKYVIEGEPEIHTRNANNNDHYETVQDGVFDLRMQAFASRVGGLDRKALIVTGNTFWLDKKGGLQVDPFGDGYVRHGRLRAEFVVRQDKKANRGNMELALQLTPRAFNGQIKEFNGLYELGAGTILKDGSAGLTNRCMKKDGVDCDFTKLVKEASNYQDLVDNGYLKPFQQFSFERLKIRFFMVEAGETATRRSVAYTASTCIRDRVTGERLANTPMKIKYALPEGKNLEKFGYSRADRAKIESSFTAGADEKINQQKKKEIESNLKKFDDELLALQQSYKVEKTEIFKETDNEGCLSWDGEVFHRYYEPEQYFQRVVNISFDYKDEKASEKTPNYVTEHTFFVNPWDTNINFGFDKEEFTEAKVDEIRHREKIPSRFFLGNYSYHTVQFLYNIDPFMELEVKKTVLMELSPQVLRYSGIKDARKMTEHLRDGIYLMKVAIQKSYLDPRDNSGYLLANVPELQAKKMNLGNDKLATKEFITTNMSLVRVVDGYIIYPVELTMRDLRLMRVRSNMLIQLETVDERLIQAYHVLRERAVSASDLERLLNDYRSKLKVDASTEDVKRDLGISDMDPALKTLSERRQQFALCKEKKGCSEEEVAQAAANLEARVSSVQTTIIHDIRTLKSILENGGPVNNFFTKHGGQPNDLIRGELIANNFALPDDILEKLKTKLEINDFSTVTLPKMDDIDPTIFVEKDSGLKRRTFVGPVIYLSNAYSDSMRATDNLDEVRCVDPENKPDALSESRAELQMSAREISIVRGDDSEHPSSSISPMFKTEKEFENNRQNNAYQASAFFGSLSNLCYKNVDDLIKSERKLKRFNENQLIAASLKYNFLKSYPFPMDYISLTNEPMLKVQNERSCKAIYEDPEKEMESEELGNIMTCLRPTEENTLNKNDLPSLVNPGLEDNLGIVTEDLPPGSKTGWDPNNYDKLFFEITSDSKVGVCNLMANRLSLLIQKELPEDWDGKSWLKEKIYHGCAELGGLIHDVKYRVEKTDNYTFLGGLNLNFNVGVGFSTGWSGSWSVGFDPSDWVGSTLSLAGYKVAAAFIKPVSIKTGESMSNSSGTSVSESTYLVSQIAKFGLDLVAYEKCAVLRISESGVKNILKDIQNGPDYDVPESVVKYGWKNGPGKHVLTSMTKDEWARFEAEGQASLVDRLRRGLFVCEGDQRKNNPVKHVEEMYFYFTQHFTEGDMLDQANLYNHPWLLGLRGMRDFLTFVAKIRAQEIVNVPNFLRGLDGSVTEFVRGSRATMPASGKRVSVFGDEDPENGTRVWALDQMSHVYKNTMPSFPGFYSLVNNSEDISAFLLQQSRSELTTHEMDPLGEVTHRQLGAGTAFRRNVIAPIKKFFGQ